MTNLDRITPKQQIKLDYFKSRTTKPVLDYFISDGGYLCVVTPYGKNLFAKYLIGPRGGSQGYYLYRKFDAERKEPWDKIEFVNP